MQSAKFRLVTLQKNLPRNINKQERERQREAEKKIKRRKRETLRKYGKILSLTYIRMSFCLFYFVSYVCLE